MTRVLLAVYRVRGPLYYGAGATLILSAALLISGAAPGGKPVLRALAIAAVALATACAVASFAVPPLLRQPATLTVHSPVRGRWLALNSPTSKVPSHGVRAYGQAYAIDLLYEPDGVARPQFGGPGMRPPTDYPAFGQPVLAMISGTVVRACGWRRDHRSRSNAVGLMYLVLEGMFRELGGPGFIVGNHVVIRGHDGEYALLAHLQRGSVRVGVGQRVEAGQPIARCGNSGNSTEPHVHAQLMDRVSVWTGQGIPMAFAQVGIGDSSDLADGLPADQEHLIA